VKLILSWSKDRSRQVATVLHEWLPSVINRVQPWMSSEDIDKGTRWGAELADRLAGTDQGVVCVTAENMREPWLNFEAGTLAKAINSARVRPVLLDVAPADLTGPLTQFQATSLLDKEDVFKLVGSLNGGTAEPVAPGVLARSFERAWPELHDEISKLARVPASGRLRSVRSADDKIDEILDLLRAFDRRGPVLGSRMSIAADDLVVDFSEIDRTLGAGIFSISDFGSVSTFLDEMYFRISDFVNSYQYLVVWELYDVRRNVVFNQIGTAWARKQGQARDKRTLAEVGLLPGMILAARRIL